MKFIKNSLCLVAVLTVILPVFGAPPDPINVFAVSTTNANDAIAYAIVPARSGNNGTPVVTFIDAASDLLTAKVQFGKVIEQTQCTYTNSTVSIPVNSTNTGTKWDAGYVVIQHRATENYEQRYLATSGGATNLQVTAATLEAVLPGDIIYKIATNSGPSLTLRTNTVTDNQMNLQIAASAPIVVGQKGKPLLIQVNRTTTKSALNAVGGYYAPNP